MEYQVITSDIMDWLNLANRYGYKQNYYHAMLLDPPYHLTSITKRFSKSNMENKDTPNRSPHYKRLSKGFMGQTWDGGDLAFNPELWFALKERLLPGAFCFAFAGSRGWHRMATAIEDAGFIMHPTIFLWAYGSGFPKATRIDTQIDKAVGAERDAGKIVDGAGSTNTNSLGPFASHYPQVTPSTPEAAQWEGHRYGLQAIKPAAEVALTFSKPLDYEPIYGIISETTFFVEAILCLLSPALDVKNLINQVHQHLRVVVGNSVQDNAEVWELLKSVKFVGLSSESNLADFTLQNFVAENVLTRDAMLHLVRTIIIGQIPDGLSVKDINISESEMASILQSIGWLWQNILAELLNRGNIYITSTATDLITDLKILNCYLSQIILDFIILEEHTGNLSSVQAAEILLRSVLTKLPLLNSTIAQESVLEKLVKKEKGQGVSQGPAVEPILCFQKPYKGRPLDSITKTGAGALNIDGGRIGTFLNDTPSGLKRGTISDFSPDNPDDFEPELNISKGRWPSNLILSHHPDCKKVGVKKVKTHWGQPTRGTRKDSIVNIGSKDDKTLGDSIGYADPDGFETVTDWQCVDDCPVKKLGEQSGDMPSSARPKSAGKTYDKYNLVYGKWDAAVHNSNHTDSGTAYSFFYQSHFAHDDYIK